MPDHFRNTPKGKKIIEKVVKDLVNNEWAIILPKRTGKSFSDHISLNPRKVSEIKQFLAD